MSLNKQISILKVITMYIGAVIGAGFASGQEIMQFITLHGLNGLKEVVLITALFAYLGASILYLSVKLSTDNYLALINYLMGKKVGKMLDLLSMLMLFGGLSVMLSGSGAIFSEHFNISAKFGIFIVVVINCFILLGGLNGVVLVNAVLVPIKIIAILIISLLILQAENTSFVQNNAVLFTGAVTGHWLWSGVLYVSYNMILVVAVLTTLGKSITKKVALWGGAAGGASLGIIAGIMYLAGLSLYPEIINYKVPMLYMAGKVGQGFKYIMGVLIWLAILTTTVANAHGFAARMADAGSKNYKIIGIGATLLAVPLAGMDFDRLVGTIYPLFGYAGLLLMLFLIMAPLLVVRRRQ